MDALWKTLCTRLWQGKANVVQGEIYYRAIMDYDKLLTTAECETMLQARRRNLPQLPTDKQGLVQELMQSELLFEVFPDYGERFTRSKWKASYVYSLVDCTRRDEITRAELVNAEWTFMFKYQPDDFLSIATFKEPEEEGGRALLIMRPNPIRHVFPWELADNAVYIMNFPAHRVSRIRETWGFRMENRDVIFIQSNFPGFDLARTRQQIQVEFPDYAFFEDYE